MTDIHVGDIGTTFEIALTDAGEVVDLSTNSGIEIIFKNPSAQVTTKTATLVGDGTTGRIKYVTVANDLSIAGSWQMQAKVSTPSGTWSSSIIKFKVLANL